MWPMGNWAIVTCSFLNFFFPFWTFLFLSGLFLVEVLLCVYFVYCYSNIIDPFCLKIIFSFLSGLFCSFLDFFVPFWTFSCGGFIVWSILFKNNFFFPFWTFLFLSGLFLVEVLLCVYFVYCYSNIIDPFCLKIIWVKNAVTEQSYEIINEFNLENVMLKYGGGFC